jgi:hypothetical protein
MAADDETRDAVRRLLKDRPPEALPAGAEGRLRRRLDEEKPRRKAPPASRPAASRKNPAAARKKKTTKAKA